MTIRLQEVVRSEVDGGLAGPANPIPNQSIDCGYGQLPCPKLAKFATRRLFVGLMLWVGLMQAAAYAYLYIVGPTIARRFQFDPYVMEWVIVISDLTPFVLGILVAYWGDRIHRAAWIGSIVLLQSVSYFIMIIPHLTHQTKVIEETENVTHMSIYAGGQGSAGFVGYAVFTAAIKRCVYPNETVNIKLNSSTDDSRELCSETSSIIIGKEDEPCYFTFAVIVSVQVVSGIANIVYYTLGVSYLDDNTKKRHVAVFIGALIAVKFIGVLLGYMLSWICLRIDAVTLSPIESYREQIGAWWLGLPILTVLLIVPGLLLSWFPRMLPSEVVEKAAASLLKNSNTFNRAPRRLISQKVGSPNFWPSLGRLLINKLLICQVLACTLYVAAIVNFMGYENLIAQSRFHVPKPTGMFLGFEDPFSSRLILNILKPILVGLIIIISGLVIAKAKPSARSVTSYSIIVVLLASGIIFALTATSSVAKPIVGTTSWKSFVLLKYCNKHCGCSNDADFRPVCDSKGMFTFYSPCHAGCTSAEVKQGITTYGGCSCVEEMTGLGNTEAIDGSCNSNNNLANWLTFEFGTLLTYVLISSSFVGDLLIVLRSVNAQDKAISIGFWMTCSAIIVNGPGKIVYDVIANLTCQFWGTQKVSCHLHDGQKLGNYLCYLTGSLLGLCALLKILIWFFCKNLKIYTEREEGTAPGTEMQDLIRVAAAVPKQQREQTNARNDDETTVQVEATDAIAPESTSPSNRNQPQQEEGLQTEVTPLKYGPLGPGSRRTDSKSSLNRTSQTRKSRIRTLDSEDELSTSDEEVRKDSSPKVAYRPLDIDSDVESDLSHVEPRSRKRIISGDYDRVYNSDRSSSVKSSLPRREFPNPDNYDDPRLNRRIRYKHSNENLDGSSKTNSFEFSNRRQDNVVQKKGDFNEIGIPIIEPADTNSTLKDVKSLISQYELNAEQRANADQESLKSGEDESPAESRMISGIPLVAMASKRPSSRGQPSSVFSGLADGKIPEARPESRGSVSTKASSKGSAGTLHTDL